MDGRRIRQVLVQEKMKQRPDHRGECTGGLIVLEEVGTSNRTEKRHVRGAMR